MVERTWTGAGAGLLPCYSHPAQAASARRDAVNERYCLGDLREKSFEEIWRTEHRRKVLDELYANFDLDQCHCLCKPHHVNKATWELANPPLHKNFL